MSESLSPSMCDCLRRLLTPPHDPAAAQAVVDALRGLVPEARVTYLLGARFCAWSPADAPPELRPPLAEAAGAEWSVDGLCFRSAGTPCGPLGVAIDRAGAEAIQPRLDLAASLMTAGWRAEAFHSPQTHQLLTLGEATGGLLHGLNNHLNGMVMHAALLQAQAPEAVRERPAAIRRLGGEAAQQTRMAQAVRAWPAVEGETACLHAAFMEAWFESGDHRLAAELTGPGPYSVSASAPGLRRLFELIISVARACVGAEIELRAVLSTTPGGQFRLVLPGETGAIDADGHVSFPPAGSHFAELERQAVNWLAREQGARLTLAAAERGLELCLGWPAPPSGPV